MTNEERPETETERLLTRLVDREASGTERDRFERLAESDASLWRDLALRQFEMGLLADRVAQRTAGADHVELPPPRRSWINLSVTVSGWAAVVVLGLIWALAATGDRVGPQGAVLPLPAADPGATAANSMSHDEHLLSYLAADWVLGELDEVLLKTERLPDGRVRLRYIRRIEEYIDIDEPVEKHVDDMGRFKADPSQLRDDR